MSKLGVYEFGQKLIETKDLDPMYVILWEASLPRDETRKWLLAYWCFYHAGTACWITEQRDFWIGMMTAAGDKLYPRSSERRHYRGQQAKSSVEWLESIGLESLFLNIEHNTTAQDMMSLVKCWRGFGDWISFKVADMVERLDIAEVRFTPNDIFGIFDSPRKGAELMAEKHGPANGNVYTWAHDQLIGRLSIVKGLKAPPRYERDVNVQEVETILCKWKSHMGDHYEVGKDIEEIRHGLTKFGKCKLAQRLLRGGREGGLW